MDALERRVLLCTLDHLLLPLADSPNPLSISTENIHQLHPLALEAEPNNTADLATSAAGNDTLTGSLSNAADVDFYSTVLSQGDYLQVRPGGDPGQLHYHPLVEIIDPDGGVLARSLDGHHMGIQAVKDGTYLIRVSANNAWGAQTGPYGTLSISVTAFSGASESEPNNTTSSSDPLGAGVTDVVRGSLSGLSDIDYFSFTGVKSSAIVLKFLGAPGKSPAVRLYTSGNTLLAEDRTGVGLAHVLATDGTYRISLRPDNVAGAVTGGYAFTTYYLPSLPKTEIEPISSFSTSAATLTPTDVIGVRGIGVLSSMDDVDVWGVDLKAGSSYSFTFEGSTSFRARGNNRLLGLYNEYGQLLEYSHSQSLSSSSATGFGFRPERTGRHYLLVQATEQIGLGGYSIYASLFSQFPSQRDVPLYFLDFTDQTSHLGFNAISGISNPDTIPALLGMFNARHDIYDVDATTIKPASNFYIGFGMGEYGSIGSYGSGGNFFLGSRRSSGDALIDDLGTGFTTLANLQNPTGVMNQEIGHGTGLYQHARHPLAYMGYNTQSALNVIGSYFSFPWTNTNIPDVELRNEREFYDWVLQSGRIANEVESNNSQSSPQALSGFMNEMSGDADGRNDRVALAGRINSTTDADFYSFTAAANETWAIDIDAAEFQVPLDATIALYTASGSLLSVNYEGLDRESGLHSIDPYLTYKFNTAGTYLVRVTGARGSIGHYRLKLTPQRAWDTAGPRVIASWPNGGSSIDSTRQLTLWFDDQIDLASLSSSNIVVSSPSAGVRGGTFVFDATDATLVWTADSALPPGSYTIMLRSGAGGIRDLRGNSLDGETDGTLNFPQISGDGLAGGDFVSAFNITAADNTPTAVTSVSASRNAYNRYHITLNLSDELDVVSAYTSGLILRGQGSDGIYNTADDVIAPLDVLYDKVANTASRQLHLYTRGIPDAGQYRAEGAVRDAAGHSLSISAGFSVASSSQFQQGPSIIDASIQPGSILTSSRSSLSVQFSSNINPVTLTTVNFKLRFSPDAEFFDSDDSYVTDADGVIAWSATARTATFTSAQSLGTGYYLLELSGKTGGIASTAGRLLDGEFLDSHIAGNSLYSHWHDAPSGDGIAGGDYRASFAIAVAPATPGTPDLVASSDGGLSSSDNITNDSTSSFTGTAQSGTVRLFANGTMVGSTTASGGTYSITAGMLADGVYAISAVFVDSTGTASDASPSLTVTIDTVTPTALFAAASPASVSSPIGGMTFFFSEPVSGFDLSDLRLTRDFGANIISSSHQLITGDNTLWLLTDLTAATSRLGTYELSLVLASSGITDAAGNVFDTPVSTGWRMNALYGSSVSDIIRLKRSAGNPAMTEVFGNSTSAAPDYTVNMTLLDSQVYVFGQAGDDELIVDFSSGNPVELGIIFDGGDSSNGDALVLRGTAADDVLTAGDTDISFNSAALSRIGVESIVLIGGAGNDTFNITAGQHHFYDDLVVGTPQLNLNLTGGETFFHATQHLKTLNLAAAAQATLISNGGRRILANSFTLAPTARLDLADNALIIRNGSLAQIESHLRSGFNGGNWQGHGIVSSAAAGEPLFGLGYAANASLGYGEFAGETGLTGNELLVRYTKYGDADLNGTVNLDDFNHFLAGFNGAGAGWINGDFDYGGTVNLDDFNSLLAGLQ